MIREFRDEDLDDVMKIWLNTNIEAHEFIQKEYWINNFNRVKELLPTSEIYRFYMNDINRARTVMRGVYTVICIFT